MNPFLIKIIGSLIIVGVTAVTVRAANKTREKAASGNAPEPKADMPDKKKLKKKSAPKPTPPPATEAPAPTEPPETTEPPEASFKPPASEGE